MTDPKLDAALWRIADEATREIHGDDYRIATRLVIGRAIQSAIDAEEGLSESTLERLREACAKVVDEYHDRWNHRDQVARNFAYCAMKIRALDLSAFAPDSPREDTPMAMLPNEHHPGPRCCCSECLRAYPYPALAQTYRDMEEHRRLMGMPPISQHTPETKATLRITEQLREAANFIESCHAANVDLLNRKGDLERRLHEAQLKSKILTNSMNSYRDTYTIEQKRADAAVRKAEESSERIYEMGMEIEGLKQELAIAKARVSDLSNSHVVPVTDYETALRENEREKLAIRWACDSLSNLAGEHPEKTIEAAYRYADDALAEKGKG